jgi:predicted phosphatase
MLRVPYALKILNEVFSAMQRTATGLLSLRFTPERAALELSEVLGLRGKIFGYILCEPHPLKAEIRI